MEVMGVKLVYDQVFDQQLFEQNTCVYKTSWKEMPIFIGKKYKT